MNHSAHLTAENSKIFELLSVDQ